MDTAKRLSSADSKHEYVQQRWTIQCSANQRLRGTYLNPAHHSFRALTSLMNKALIDWQYNQCINSILFTIFLLPLTRCFQRTNIDQTTEHRPNVLRTTKSIQDWTLQIKYVQLRDAGLYECQVSVHPPASVFINLSVVGKIYDSEFIEWKWIISHHHSIISITTE